MNADALARMIDTLVRHNTITAIILAIGVALTIVLRYGLPRWTQR